MGESILSSYFYAFSPDFSDVKLCTRKGRHVRHFGNSYINISEELENYLSPIHTTQTNPGSTWVKLTQVSFLVCERN